MKGLPRGSATANIHEDHEVAHLFSYLQSKLKQVLFNLPQYYHWSGGRLCLYSNGVCSKLSLISGMCYVYLIYFFQLQMYF